MTGWAAVLAATSVIALGAGVLVFKQHVDAEERRLAQLQRELAAAETLTGQLLAELAYHRRPAYVLGFADALGLAPASTKQITALSALPPRPIVTERDGTMPTLVALPSGAFVTLRRRPEPLQLVGLAP